MLYLDLCQEPSTAEKTEEKIDFQREAVLYAWELFIHQDVEDDEDMADRISGYAFERKVPESRGACFNRHEYTYTMSYTNGRDDGEMIIDRDTCHYMIEALAKAIDDIWQGLEQKTRDDILDASSEMRKLSEYSLAISDIMRSLEITERDMNTVRKDGES